MPERPAGELLGIDDPEVDLQALQAEVRTLARRLRGGEPAADGTLPRRREPVLLDTADITPYPAPSGGGGPGGAALAVQRSVRRALRWYLWPVTARVGSHNRAVAEVVETQRRELSAMRREAERLAGETTLLDRRL